MYSSLARWCYRHPWRVFAAWLGVIAAVAVPAAAFGASYSARLAFGDTESSRGADILNAHFGSIASVSGGTVVFRAEQGVTDPAVQAAMTGLFTQIDAVDGIEVASPYDPGDGSRIARGGTDAGRVAYADVGMSARGRAYSHQVERLVDESGLRAMPGLRIELGGEAFAEGEPPESEAIGLAFAVFVLIVTLGSVMAMGITIGAALVGVGIGAAGVMVFSHFVSVPEFAPTLGVMIGLGVGIDYALFIITRYREQTGLGMAPEDAVAAALDSAGRSVVFAGATVAVSLLGLLFMGIPLVAGLGVATAVAVMVVMTGAVTLLPAAIGLLGDRVSTTRVRGVAASALIALALLGLGVGVQPRLLGLPAALALAVLVAGSFGGDRNPLHRKMRRQREKPLRETAWHRLSRFVQSHPLLFAVSGTAVLLVLAAPVLSMRLGFSDEGNLPEETTTRKAYDLIADGFGPGANGPLIVVAELPDPRQAEAFSSLSGRIARTEGVASVSSAAVSPDGAAAMIRVQPATGPQHSDTEGLVLRLREDVIPQALRGTGLEALIAGQVAFGIDFTDYLAGRLPVFFAAVLGASFLLLMAVFRSLVVPLKAVIVNMLSIGAAYGVAVAVFQWGWLGGVIGIAPAPIDPFVPMMLFAILFGLSMDYEVFLLSRMKEEYERTGDAASSVADGLAATARVITAAAAIMTVVFGSFIFEDVRIVKLFGTGLATAIAIDATLVRMLIVPSTMELLGARNWWLPRWLGRVIPDFKIEGGLARCGAAQDRLAQGDAARGSSA